jgi:hypothetical protein
VGVKDLLDVFYMQGGGRKVVLYAITIDPHQPISMSLSDLGAQAAERAVKQILAELESGSRAFRSPSRRSRLLQTLSQLLWPVPGVGRSFLLTVVNTQK